MPTRLARHGMALVPDPSNRWRVDLGQGRWRGSDEPIMAGCPCPACEPDFTRGYIRHLLAIHELLAPRLLTLHNLAFVMRVIEDLRAGIEEGRLAEISSDLLQGAAPGFAS
jgi:queuine tRNA-ribosyltransferase